MNGNVIRVPAYWRQTSPGSRMSTVNWVYMDWLRSNVGLRAIDWDYSPYYANSADYLEFLISPQYNSTEVERSLKDLGIMWMLKHGPDWTPT